jgi:hypothetical protein
MSMTPIERLRNMANVQWDGAEDLTAFLAAYDARGEEIRQWRAAYEVWNDATRPGAYMRDCADAATDSAVARVEGEQNA